MNRKRDTTIDEFILWMVEQDNIFVFLCSRHLSAVERVLYNRAYRDYEGWFKGPTCDAPQCSREALYEYYPQIKAEENI